LENLFLINYDHKKIKKVGTYFFFGAAFIGAFAAVFTFFIGLSQQTTSQAVHPHSSSTTKTKPHSSHLYLSPFAKIIPHVLSSLPHI
jgi:uncharacterized membrane protein